MEILKFIIVMLSLAATIRWAVKLGPATKEVTEFGQTRQRRVSALDRMSVSFTRVAIGLGVMIVLLVGLSSFGTVGAGERGVVLRFGATTGRVVEPGLYAVTPFVESVRKLDVQVQVDKTKAGAASKDLQGVTTEIALNYSVDPKYAAWLYRTIGDDFKSRVIDPAVQEAVKAVTARYNAENLISERDLVKSALLQEISVRLSQSHILVSGVSITDFSFSPEFTQAIEQKVVATQQALKAQNDLVTKKAEAEQAVVAAQAQAEAIRIQAEAVQHQGGAAYVQLRMIERWNGALPQNIYGSAPIPFLNISK